MRAQEVLQQYFGYQAFRPGQAEIVQSIISRRDTLVLLPTGGGKSVCFQVPALLLKGTTVVISPLLSLIDDQVSTLQRKQVAAAQLSSTQRRSEKNQVLAKLKQGELKLLYLSPEMFIHVSWPEILSKVSIPLVVIDEAHCVITWGRDFRPAYQHIPSRIASWPTRPTVAAFTATATPGTQKLLLSQLQLQHPAQHRQSCFRPNLHINVKHLPTRYEKFLKVVRLLRHHQGEPGIIYCATRAACEELVAQLKPHLTTTIDYYHAGRSATERQSLQAQFLGGELSLLVSTNAFGMGVDKPNIRFVIHYQPSTSVENYYQEIGRAGRDGAVSHCYLLWTAADWELLKELLEDKDLQITTQRYQQLHHLIKYCMARHCRHRLLLHYFGEWGKPHHCQRCDRCQQWLEPVSDLEKIISQRLILIQQKNNLKLNSVIAESIIVLNPAFQNSFQDIPGIGDGWFKTWWPILQPVLPQLYQPPNVDTTHHH